jgi:hypothetical protein
MGKGNLFSAEQFTKAIPGSAGIITTIAKRVGCDWHTAKKYIEEYATIRQAYADECEAVLDMAEAKLYKAVEKGDLQAVKYILSTKGKRRGYVERQEVTGAGGGEVKIRIGVKDDDNV